MALQPFLLDPQNTTFVSGFHPYPAQFRAARAQTTCLLLFLLPFVAVALFLAAYSASTIYRQVLFMRGSAVVSGQVVERVIFEDEGTNYRLAYAFTVGDRTYQHAQITERTIYEQYAVGQPIPIRVAVDNPDFSHIDGANSWGMDAFMLGFAVCWWLFVGGVLYSLLRSALRSGRLRRHGQLIMGQLVRMQGTLDSDNDYTVTVTARFTPPDTQLPISGTRTYLCNRLKSTALPAAETPLAILYADAAHWEVL